MSHLVTMLGVCGGEGIGARGVPPSHHAGGVWGVCVGARGCPTLSPCWVCGGVGCRGKGMSHLSRHAGCVWGGGNRGKGVSLLVIMLGVCGGGCKGKGVSHLVTMLGV